MKHQRGDFSRNSRLPFLSFLAMIIGLVAAVVAKGLLYLIALFTNIFYFAEFTAQPRIPSMEHWGPAFIFVPVVGCLLIGLMARFGTEKIRGHGIPEALEAILFGKSIMEPKVAILKPLSSAISIGSGGPFGAEGPIIMTGGAFGSILAQFFNLTSAERKTLLVAGAAAGMSAVFATPVAAVLLAVELMLFEWKPRSLVPVAVASSIALLTRTRLLGAGPIFPETQSVPFTEALFVGALAVGLATGVFSTLLSKSLYKLEDLFRELPIHWMWWPALGGLVVGIGGYFQPRALSVGYDVIGDLLSNHLALGVILSIFLVKSIIWIFALASGTSGGVLAPLLIFGCSIGSLFGHWFYGAESAGTWALIGMGAVMGGMMRSPLTAIMFCFELTRNPDVLPPLLVASIISYACTVLVMKRSILTEKVARRGFDFICEYNVDPLERFTVKEVMKKGAASPEVLADGKAPSIYSHETCRVAAERMALHNVTYLIALSDEDANSKGVVTLQDLLTARRFHSQEESMREVLFPIKSEGLVPLVRETLFPLSRRK